MAKRLVFVSLLFALPAYAADVGCGVDTDRSGTHAAPDVDQGCIDPDNDFDKYPSSDAYSGPYGTDVDCDDDNFFVYPGIETQSGCSAGQYRTCPTGQTDGAFTACANISDFTCHGSGGTTWWVDDGEANCTGAGTYADPENILCLFDTGMSGFHSPGTNDCIVIMDGTYTFSATYGSELRQIYSSSESGLTIREEPGTRPVLNGTSSSPTEVEIIHLVSCDDCTVRGLELDGTSDYSGSGVRIEGGENPTVFNMYIHDIGGESDNNLSGVKCQNDTDGCNIHHNLMDDNCEVGSCTNQNSGHVTIMDDVGTVSVVDNVLIYSTTTGGFGARVKHREDRKSVV